MSPPTDPGARPDGEVEGAMQTPDGAWRIEVVRRRRNRWYRIVHGDQVFDWLSVTAVERILDDAGVDRHLLVEAGPVGG